MSFNELYAQIRQMIYKEVEKRTQQLTNKIKQLELENEALKDEIDNLNYELKTKRNIEDDLK